MENTVISDYEEYDASDDIPQHHVPNCDEEMKPVVGQCFENFEYAVDFYKIYAGACGFDIRRGTVQKARDGSVVRQYLYCNREGEKNALNDNVDTNSTRVKRRRVSKRVGCMARISFKFDVVQGCVVENFEEGHTHPLVSVEFRKYLKVNRNLGYMEKKFLMNCARANMGPTKSYRFFKEMVGDYSEVGSMRNDWKTYARDLKAYIEGCDAQIILSKMVLKKESCPAFFYNYSVDKDDHLTCVFWADPIARRNYSVFGDVVSFDCTYSTNKYNMIFAPFTGKDNHGKIVTFGAALLSGEDNNMYTWVFEKFKECMGRAPTLIITDQDPAMKIALHHVFPDSAHCLCMWHIMMKVSEKTPAHLKKNESFRQRLNAIVWSDNIVTSIFEQQWTDIMVDYGLIDNSWFIGLYDIRQFWIPAYFRDLPMSGLCRTTSISESVNSFFSHYLRKGSNLVEFLMHFDSAIDAQRQSNDMLNSVDSSSVALLKTPLQLEKHAASIYTTNLFIKVQEEIEASCFRCSLTSMKQCDARMLYEVDDGSTEMLTVTYDKDDDNIVCSCNKFVREDMLCCHIFLLFKQLKWSVIPDKYIVSRWTRTAYANPLSDIGNLYLDRCVGLDDNRRLINKLTSVFYACVGVVEGDKDKAQFLLDGICNLKDALVAGDDESSLSTSKTRMFDLFYGLSKPDEVQVHPPLPVKTKGSGSRLRSRREVAIERAKKPKRMCSKCKTLSNHDARNCKG